MLQTASGPWDERSSWLQHDMSKSPKGQVLGRLFAEGNRLLVECGGMGFWTRLILG